MRKPLSILSRLSPAKLFVVLLVAIVLTQSLAVYFLHGFDRSTDHGWFHEFMELALFALLCGPLLWFALIRPLQNSQRREYLKAKTIIDTAAEGIMTIDERGRILTFNPAAERIFGYCAEEVIGKSVGMLMPKSEREQHDSHMRNYLATGKSNVVGSVNTFGGMRKDGTVFPMELAVSEADTPEGRVFTGIVHDISRHLAVEAALAKSNELLERIFSNLHTLVAYLDANFNFIRVNLAYAQADGQSPDFFTGKNHFALYPDAENEAIFREVMETGEPYIAYAKPFEYPDHPERGITYWDWGLYPIHDAKGKVDGLLLTLIDVTERARAEQRHRAAEAKFRTLFDNANDAIFIHEPNGRFLEVNQIACERLGYSREELLQMSPAEIDVPESAAKVPERFEELKGRDGILFESVHLRRDGEKIPVEIHARLIEFEGAPAVLSVARDINQRKTIEAALHVSEQAAKALLNATTESALLLDLDGKVLAANEIGAQRFRSTPQEMLGRNLFDLMPAEVAKRRRSYISEVIRSGQPITFEDEREDIHFETSVYPILGSQDRVISLAVYATDVTQEKQREAVDRLLQDIDQMALSGLGMGTMFDLICDRMVKTFGLALVWVGEKQPGGLVDMLAWRGPATGYAEELRQLGVRWDDTSTGRGPTGAAIRTGRVQAFKTTDARFQSWRDMAAREGLEAIMSLPIVLRGEIFGAITLYSSRSDNFDNPAVIRRFEGILSRIVVALEMAMEQQEVRLLSGALAAASNAVFIASRDGRIEWANEALCKLTGYRMEEVIGQNPRFLKSGRHEADYYKALWNTILAGETWHSETLERHKDGRLYTVKQTITPIRDASGEISHFITIHEDITAQKATEARIHRMAHYDALTDLPNRNLFYDRLQQAMSLSKRNDHYVALLFLDLDRFKQVNDTLGHAIGDLLLQAVADRLRACVRESDTVARLAGDEFTVILPDAKRREDVALVAEKIVRAIAEPFSLEGHEVRIGTSIGIALYSHGKESVDDLVNQADKAMYVAKTESRNTYRFAAPGTKTAGPGASGPKR